VHEMSLAESVLQIVRDAARTEGFSRVRMVRLEIGQLAGVEPEAMRFCFDVVSRETLADQARLEIVATPGEGWCIMCSRPVPIAARFDACPVCGSYQVQATGGLDMRVSELEVE
jgi:hydrogenase nickel incorporation protein HypA/HybF